MPHPAHCTHAMVHVQSIAYTSYACSAQLALNIHYRQASVRSGYDYGVVHIKYVVT